ncbi:MAG TPA: signal peptide peptidase SppA, partial [Bryobacteraceae bacterium]|nr:signal peptide peptidase SppA [Bryobacteraceae bacterium]
LEVTNQILDQYYGSLVDVIAQARRRTPDQVRAAIDTGPFVGESAVNAGLVDKLLFEDQAYGELKDRIHLEIRKIGEQDYLAARADSDSGPKIAFIAADGDITRGSEHSSDASGGITSIDMVKTLRDVAGDSSIKGAILRIDSPGGDGIASDDILHAAKDLSSKKPVIISMSDLAASGGYFIAVTGDPIIAYPNTLTGSIGVFFGKPVLKGLYDKIGVDIDTLKRGKFADIDTTTRPLNDEERAKLRTELEGFYRRFVERVAAGRKRPYDQIEPLAQGRAWTGEQAKQNGLVDDLGGIDLAIDLIKQRAKIGASDKVTLVAYPPKQTIWDVLFSRSDESADFESAIARRLVLSHTRALTRNLPIHALMHGGILELLPYSIEVK